MSELDALSAAVTSGNQIEAKRLTHLLLDAGTPLQEIIDRGLVPGMAEIGERFKCNEAFVPEMLISARAMKQAMSLLEPLLVKAGIRPEYTAIIGSVQGDLHDIGKNLVAVMWKGANIRVIDLGTNVGVEAFVAAAKEHRADVIGLSGLLTTTMPAMAQTVAALKRSGLNGAKVVVGGAPITGQFAREIGADGFAADAASAVDMVLELLGK